MEWNKWTNNHYGEDEETDRKKIQKLIVDLVRTRKYYNEEDAVF